MFIGDNAYEKENDGSLISTDALTAGTMSPLGVSAEEQPEVSTEHVEIQELGAGVYTGTCGEGAEYTLDENGTLTITGNGSIDFGAFRGFGKRR